MPSDMQLAMCQDLLSRNLLTRELQLCLWDLLDDEKEGGTADDWVDAGGLTRVNEVTFQVFLWNWSCGSI